MLDEGTLIKMYWIKQIQKLPTLEECQSLGLTELKRKASQMNVDFATISEGYICGSNRTLEVKIGELDESLRFKAILYWSLYGSITEEYFLKDNMIWDLTDESTIKWIKKLKLLFGDCHQISQLALHQVLMYAKSDM